MGKQKSVLNFTEMQSRAGLKIRRNFLDGIYSRAISVIWLPFEMRFQNRDLTKVWDFRLMQKSRRLHSRFFRAGQKWRELLSLSDFPITVLLGEEICLNFAVFVDSFTYLLF